MRMHGLCCRPVSVRLSARSCIVSRWLTMSKFVLGPVAHHSDAKHRYPIPGEIPSAGALNTRTHTLFKTRNRPA